ncbi:MAG: TrkA C-terminal domain-containing protein [Acholeplasmatales bacterium]|nr:TrkA C-terminal domain-containing protein [Acholeplasmatales bacterium]
MDLVSSILAISIAIVIYIYIIELFTILFRITGLTKEKAKFQVISLVTCAGFTTSEAEIITLNKRRRHLAIICMITGTIFNVLIISIIINLISNISKSGISVDQIKWISIILVSAIALIILFKIPVIAHALEKITEKFLRKVVYHSKNDNVLTILDSYDSDAIIEIYLNNVPEVINNKTLAESDLKNKYDINLLMLKRGNRTITISRNTVIQKNDKIIVFGNKQTIKDLFTYKTDTTYEEDIISEKKENILTLIDNYGSDAMAEIEVNVIPEILNNKTLFESPIKTKYNLNILMIKRNELPLKVTKDSKVELHDEIVIFGDYSNIKKIFLQNN